MPCLVPGSFPCSHSTIKRSRCKTNSHFVTIRYEQNCQIQTETACINSVSRSEKLLLGVLTVTFGFFNAQFISGTQSAYTFASLLPRATFFPPLARLDSRSRSSNAPADCTKLARSERKNRFQADSRSFFFYLFLPLFF